VSRIKINRSSQSSIQQVGGSPGDFIDLLKIKSPVLRKSLMDNNPPEAVLNNIIGLQTLLRVRKTTALERFLFISSDKAVNSPSIMGATKRIGELLIHEHAALQNCGEAIAHLLIRAGLLQATSEQRVAVRAVSR
jgi:hypothetical protein